MTPTPTAASTKYEGPSDSSTTPPAIILPPVDGTRLEQKTAALASSAWTCAIRARWNFVQRINIPCNHRSVVLANITELKPNPATGALDLPFIGAAHMWIRNVAPGDGFVFVTGYIDWDRDLDVQIGMLIA